MLRSEHKIHNRVWPKKLWSEIYTMYRGLQGSQKKKKRKEGVIHRKYRQWESGLNCLILNQLSVIKNHVIMRLESMCYDPSIIFMIKFDQRSCEVRSRQWQCIEDFEVHKIKWGTSQAMVRSTDQPRLCCLPMPLFNYSSNQFQDYQQKSVFDQTQNKSWKQDSPQPCFRPNFFEYLREKRMKH